MRIRPTIAAIFSGTLAPFLTLLSDSSCAETALPEVNVTVASPIVRRPPPTRPRPARPQPARAPAPAPAPPAEAQPATPPGPVVAEAPPRGTLPIVTDQFATITVVPSEEIRRNNTGTLGDLLFSKPGITGSSFAPGASSRPIIRGLDVNRVGITENGIGGGGVSDLGEDHFVPIDPLTTNQVEVIRGPATLRYGSQSIGGIVNATDNRIPETLPCGPGTPSPRADAAGAGSDNLVLKAPRASPALGADPGCAVFETRGALTSVDNGINGAALVDAAKDNFAFHADASGRHADDYGIPKYPYLFVPGRPFGGFQPNTALHTEGGSVGGSYVFADGFVGLAVTQNNALYGIPGIDGEDHHTRIDAQQTKVMSKGEYRPESSAVETVRYWMGFTNYHHNELGLADPTDFASDGVRQIFTNHEQEGRVEVTFRPVELGLAALTTAVGVQAGHQALAAPSPDNPGLFSPNENWRVAAYVFNQFNFRQGTKAQISGRVEDVNLNGSFPDVAVDLLTAGAPLVETPRNPRFTPASAAAGVLQDLPWSVVASLTAQYVERAPKPAELFSRGAHDATATFDVGDPNLKIEAAKSVEAGLRRSNGPFRFEVTAYYTRFHNFIFRQLEDVLCGDTFETCGNGDPDNGNRLAFYVQRDAVFRGGEFQSQLDVGPLWTGIWGIEDQFDIVRATFTDGTNVPRIPPVRLGGGLFWRNDNWLARVNLLHAFAHTEVEVTPTFVETPTPGYNLLKAEVSYRWRFRPAAYGPNEATVGIVGDNLLNDAIRNSVSYTKDEVLMPGRTVRLFADVKF